MIAQLITSIRLCSALLATHGAEVSPDRLCRAAVIVAHVADEWPPELLAAIALPSENPCVRVQRDVSGNITAIETYQGGRGWCLVTASTEGPVIQRGDIPDLIVALRASLEA